MGFLDSLYRLDTTKKDASWDKMASMSVPRSHVSTVTLNGKMPVPPHTCMTITRMEGVYGAPALSPYTIGPHNYHVYQRTAE